jgi:hypothetical protein
LLLLIFSGCATGTSTYLDEEDASFVIVEKALIMGYAYKIAYHKDTKVMYVLGQYNDFTVMLDAEGNPLLWENT